MPSVDSPPTTVARRRDRISPWALWYSVLGGAVAWAVHLLVGWSFEEVGCLAPSAQGMLNRAAGPGGTTTWVVAVTTVVTWLVAAVALLTCLRLRRRLSRLDLDVLAAERTRLLLVIATFLDALALAAITGGAVGLIVLDACG